MSIAELELEVFDEGIDPDGFCRQVGRVMDIQFAPTLSFSKMYPVCRLVASPLEAGDLYKGFSQHRTVPIAPLPVLR